LGVLYVRHPAQNRSLNALNAGCNSEHFETFLIIFSSLVEIHRGVFYTIVI